MTTDGVKRQLNCGQEVLHERGISCSEMVKRYRQSRESEMDETSDRSWWMAQTTLG